MKDREQCGVTTVRLSCFCSEARSSKACAVLFAICSITPRTRISPSPTLQKAPPQAKGKVAQEPVQSFSALQVTGRVLSIFSLA